MERIGVDWGATLIKVASFCPENKFSYPHISEESAPKLQCNLRGQQYSLHFHNGKNFNYILQFVGNAANVSFSGCGIHKYEKKTWYNTNFVVEEMFGLVRGINFLLNQKLEDEIFTYNLKNKSIEVIPIMNRKINDPYILCNIGSGTSILKVEMEPNKDVSSFIRIGGSTIGGATYLGLCKLLTNLTSFEEIRALEKSGHSSKVDLLVSDIVRGDGNAHGNNLGSKYSYEHLDGLHPDTIAASFGKIARQPHHFATSTNNSVCNSGSDLISMKQDIVKSLLVMICNTIGQIVCLHSRLEGIDSIYFAGGFLREKELSGGELKARFLLHDGYIGAIGTAINSFQFQ